MGRSNVRSLVYLLAALAFPAVVQCSAKLEPPTVGHSLVARQETSESSHSHAPTRTSSVPVLSSIVASSTTSSAPSSGNSACAIAGGSCIQTTSCKSQKGTSVSGLCPQFADDMLCCFFTEADPDKCAAEGGAEVIGCVNTEYCDAQGGTTKSGLCPGPNGIKCCIGPKSWASTSFALPNAMSPRTSTHSRNSTHHSTTKSFGNSTVLTTTASTADAATPSTTKAATTGSSATASSTATSSTATGGAWQLGQTAQGSKHLAEAVLAGLVGFLL